MVRDVKTERPRGPGCEGNLNRNIFRTSSLSFLRCGYVLGKSSSFEKSAVSHVEGGGLKIVLNAMFCTASNLDQFVFESSGPNAGSAYDTIDLTYICRIDSLFGIGMGLRLLSTGHSILRTMVAFLTVS